MVTDNVTYPAKGSNKFLCMNEDRSSTRDKMTKSKTGWVGARLEMKRGRGVNVLEEANGERVIVVWLTEIKKESVQNKGG